MKCYICGKNFVIKRSLLNLLKNEYLLICDKCYHDNPIKLTYQVIPLEKHVLEIYTIFDKEVYTNYLAYTEEISMLYRYCISAYPNKLIIIDKSPSLSKTFLSRNEIIAQLWDLDIILICLFLRN